MLRPRIRAHDVPPQFDRQWEGDKGYVFFDFNAPEGVVGPLRAPGSPGLAHLASSLSSCARVGRGELAGCCSRCTS